MQKSLTANSAERDLGIIKLNESVVIQARLFIRTAAAAHPPRGSENYFAAASAPPAFFWMRILISPKPQVKIGIRI